MAILMGPTTIIPPGEQQLGFYRFATGDGSLLYLHMKTNIPYMNGSMWMVEAVGFSYGAALPIRTSWCWYSYNGVGIAYVGVQNVYGGMTAQNVYASSDGYAVLRAYLNGAYYTGFELNCYNTRGVSSMFITAASQNSNSGVYY